MHVYRTRRRRFGAGLLLAVAGILAAAAVTIGRGGEEQAGDAGARKGTVSEPVRRETEESPADRRPGPPPVRRVETLIVGSGAKAAVIVRPAGLEDPSPAVILLHGWDIGPANYGAWARHLARRRNTVILPEYQVPSVTPPSATLESAIAGVRAAFERVPVDPAAVVVAGHSAGAALAADYAAVAKERGLPAPRAVFAVYPGRAIRGYSTGIPATDLRGIPSGTRLMVLAGAADTVVGEGPAREMYGAAAQLGQDLRSFQLVTTPGAGDHFAPTRADAAARAAFWGPLDRLVAEVQR